MAWPLCELIAQNFVSISFLIARNPEQSGPLARAIRNFLCQLVS